MMPIQKIKGTINQADLGTKSLPADQIEGHLKTMGLRYKEGRAAYAAGVHNVRKIEKRTDSWDCRGANGRWIRHHGGWREELCTPYSHSRGPGKGVILSAKRSTKGTFDTGESFVIEDNWKDGANPHRRLSRQWKGKTVFFETSVQSSYTPLCG